VRSRIRQDDSPARRTSGLQQQSVSPRSAAGHQWPERNAAMCGKIRSVKQVRRQARSWRCRMSAWGQALRSLRSSSTPASASPADIRHDNQLVALGPMLSTSDRFRFWKKNADGRIAFVTPSPDGGGFRTPCFHGRRARGRDRKAVGFGLNESAEARPTRTARSLRPPPAHRRARSGSRMVEWSRRAHSLRFEVEPARTISAGRPSSSPF
jgi:hypothetical protein